MIQHVAFVKVVLGESLDGYARPNGVLELALVLLEAFYHTIDQVLATGVDAGDVEVGEGQRGHLVLDHLQAEHGLVYDLVLDAEVDYLLGKELVEILLVVDLNLK